ncbi:hypothetical protein [Streptomyces sp. NPDC004050]
MRITSPERPDRTLAAPTRPTRSIGGKRSQGAPVHQAATEGGSQPKSEPPAQALAEADGSPKAATVTGGGHTPPGAQQVFPGSAPRSFSD